MNNIEDIENLIKTLKDYLAANQDGEACLLESIRCSIAKLEYNKAKALSAWQ